MVNNSPVFLESQPPAPPYDYKLTLTTALKYGAYAAGGYLVAQQMGLTAAIVAHLPEQFSVLGGLLITFVFRALENYLKNKDNGK